MSQTSMVAPPVAKPAMSAPAARPCSDAMPAPRAARSANQSSAVRKYSGAEPSAPGITRAVVLDAVKAQGLSFEERAFTREEAYAAREAFVTSASQLVQPVVRIDGRPVGNGAPGLIATALRRDYRRHAALS